MANNKKIYTIPCKNNNILEYDPSTKEYQFIPLPVKGIDFTTLNWINGILGLNGKIYAFPFNANVILEFNPQTSEIEYIPLPENLIDQTQKYFGGIIGSDKNIYSIPWNQNTMLKLEFNEDFNYRNWEMSLYYNKC